jgi:phosphoglycerol transferase MdoB-like AlkP superfamily enzyme
MRRIALITTIALLSLGLTGCADSQPFATSVRAYAVGRIPAPAAALSRASASVEATAPAAAPAATATPVPTSTVAAAPSAVATPPTSPGGIVEARIEKIRGSQDGSRVADFSAGEYRGKNVIIVQVESLNGFLINKKYGGHEITPNLNKLITQSWYWPNSFSETGLGNTADAEFIVNTSLFAPQGQAATVKYENRVVPGLPRVLGGLGYTSFTMHPNKVLYWNRKQLYKGLGFTTYYDASLFHNADKMGPFGSSDEEIVKRATKILRGLEVAGTPVYAHIITLSSHGPFLDIPEKRRPLKTPKDLAGSRVGAYISAESYADKAIGKFVANLQATKLWDNSIVVFYGDHTAMTDNTLTGKDARGAQNLLGRPYRPIDRQRIPIIIHVPGQTTPVLRDDVAGQVDIMPSVADLVGADLTEVPHMGRSLFVASNSLVPLNGYLPGGSFLNDDVLFMPAKGSRARAVRKVTDGSWASTDASATADLKRAQQLVSISDRWMLSLKKFRGGLKGWIPDRPARAAAKPYGFLQAGMG